MYNYNWNLKDTNFTKDKGKVFSLFSCGGGSTMGYKLAGFDVIGCNEIDKKMMEVYIANHNPKYPYLEPIQEFKKQDNLPNELYNLDILDSSPPCFTGNTLVMTLNGFKKIQDISLNDYVLTHKNNYKKVIMLMNKEVDEIVNLLLQGSLLIETTNEHPFYTRRMNRRNKKNKREFSKPIWKEVKDLDIIRNSSKSIVEQDYIGVPINTKSILPANYGILNFNDNNLWYLIGRWFGDGWLRIFENNKEYRVNSRYVAEQKKCLNCNNLSKIHKRYSKQWTNFCSEKCRNQYGRKNRRQNRYDFIICCGKHELTFLKEKFDKSNLKYSITEERTTFRFHIYSKDLCMYMTQFGSGAKNKKLTSDILNLPIQYCISFLDGYLEADGHIDKKNKYSCSSISKELIFGIQSLIYKVYKVPTTIIERKTNTDYIEGRKINTNISYTLSFYKQPKAQQHGFYDNNYMWLPFRDKKYIKKTNIVYNLSVDCDESYTVYNFACHNCSSFSIAGVREDAWGKEKKFREGQAEQVLDTLFFDSIEVVKKLQPKVAIHENVKGLLLGNAKKYVSEIYQKLNDAGYYTKHFLLDASKMGVPQRRERVFFISVRKDIAENILDYEIDMFDPQLKINLLFNEKPITFGEFYQPNIIDRKVSDGKMKEYWLNRHKSDKNFADTILRIENKNRCFNNYYLHKDEVPNTLTSNSDVFYLFDEYRKPNKQEICCISTFPQDYNFLNNPYNYIAGMSVPPVMMARIANEVYQQILTKN